MYGVFSFSGAELYVARSFQGATLPSNASEQYGTMTFHDAVSLSSAFLNIPGKNSFFLVSWKPPKLTGCSEL
mgnify:FL=1